MSLYRYQVKLLLLGRLSCKLHCASIIIHRMPSICLLQPLLTYILLGVHLWVQLLVSMGSYGGYKGDAGDWPRSLYSSPRDEACSKEFTLHLVCPIANIGGVIGKDEAIISQIRQESGTVIKVDSSAAEGDDCLITVSSKEFFEDAYYPTIHAAVRLQPRCSEKVERDFGIVSFTTRLCVPTSRVGCLIGRGGAIVTEMRRLTKANICVLSKENITKIASEDDDMVQIAGDLDVAKDALIQVVTRLRANLFDKEGAVSTFLLVLPYLPLPANSDGLNYETRDSKRYGCGHSYSSGYGGSSDLVVADSYGSSQAAGIVSAYGTYGAHSSGRIGSSGSCCPTCRNWWILEACNSC